MENEWGTGILLLSPWKGYGTLGNSLRRILLSSLEERQLLV